MTQAELKPIEAVIDLRQGRYYNLSLHMEDGCELQIHGKNFEPGWVFTYPAGLTVICPHGFFFIINSKGEVRDSGKV